MPPRPSLNTLNSVARILRKSTPRPTTHHNNLWKWLIPSITAGAGATYLFTDSRGKSQWLTEAEITQLQQQGRTIIAAGTKLYDITDFMANHPGGEKALTIANGHNIAEIWKQEKYKFHLSSQNVKDYLEEYYIGQGELPTLLPTQLPIEERSHWHTHDARNGEPRKLEFDPKTGETKTFFERNSGGELSDKPQNLTMIVYGKTTTLTNAELQTYQQQDLLQPIICAGAGRSKVPGNPNGILWGSGGGDAIGTMAIKTISLRTILEKNNKTLSAPCIVLVTGSDGYVAAVHSDELDKFHMSTQQSNGEALPEVHGRERRLIGEGTPGFRNVKSVVKIETIPEKSAAEVDAILTARLKSAMKMLTLQEKQILAACPKYDAYVQRDPTTNEPFGFQLYFPVSSIITDIKRHDDVINVQGYAYGGQSPVKEVEVCLEHGPCKPANLTTPPHGNGLFQFWQAALPMKGGATIVTATAKDAAGKKQLEAYQPNTRGLFFPAAMAKQNILQSVPATDDIKTNNTTCRR